MMYTSASQRAASRQRERWERKRQILLDEICGNDPDLRAELSTVTYAQLVCVRHLPPTIPGLLRSNSLPSQESGSINEPVTEPEES